MGVTSGASVPESLVDQLLEALSVHGFDDVEVVTEVEESVISRCPRIAQGPEGSCCCRDLISGAGSSA